jgi:hypothetical protein
MIVATGGDMASARAALIASHQLPYSVAHCSAQRPRATDFGSSRRCAIDCIRALDQMQAIASASCSGASSTRTALRPQHAIMVHTCASFAAIIAARRALSSLCSRSNASQLGSAVASTATGAGLRRVAFDALFVFFGVFAMVHRPTRVGRAGRR